MKNNTITLVDRTLGSDSQLRSQTAGYAVVGCLQGVVFALLVPLLNAFFSDDPMSALPWLIAVIAVAVVCGVVLWLVTERGYHVSVEKVSDGLMRVIATHVAKLPLGWFRSGRAGQIATMVTTGVQDVMNIPSVFLQQLTVAITTPLTVVIVCFFIDWRLAVAFLIVVPLAIWTYGWLQRSVEEEQKEEAKSRAEVAAHVVEFAQVQQVLRATGQLEGNDLRIDEAIDRNHADGRRTLMKEILPMSAFNFVVEFGFLLVFVAAVYLVLGGSITVGVFAGVMVLAIRFVEPLTQVGAYGVALRKARGSLSSIDEVLSCPPLPEAEQPRVPDTSDIVFKDVDFGYGDRQVLDGLNLAMPQGSITALVGPSGGGKTTVLRLISRFWDVQRGTVTIGGIDVRDIPTPALMSMISIVFQNPYLFDDTIIGNVRIAKPGATDEEAAQAVAYAELSELAHTLPKGLDTRVGEGGHLLSGGERQRVAIARAFLKDAQILLLDEVTAALDGQKESAVTTAMRRLSRGRTVIVIAHRLTTVVEADQIVVLEGGTVAQQGTHSQLLAVEGTYQRFWHDRQQASTWKLGKRVSHEQ